VLQGAVPQQESMFSDYTSTGFESDGGAGLGNGGARGSSIKLQIASLLHSVRLLLRWPLIFANILFVFLALVFG
jgi:immediate early response 3-interacting protein 1